MEDSSNPNPATPNPPKRSRRFFTLRLLGRSLIALAILATLVALFYAEENWRGRRAWEKYKREAEARGVNLDWSKAIPPAVPDAQNFAMTPFLAPLFEFDDHNQNGWNWESANYKFADSNAFNRARDFGDEMMKHFEPRNSAPGHYTDLEAAVIGIGKSSKQPVPAEATNSRTGAANYLLDYMKRYDPVFDELRDASKRPYSRFNIHYINENPSGILLFHLATMKRLGMMLGIKSSSELAVGKADAALDDFQLTTRVADSVETEPLLISQLVRFALLKIAEKTVWEGLAEHRWSDAQLASIQTTLGKVSLIKDASLAFQGERTAYGVVFFDYVRAHGLPIPVMDTNGNEIGENNAFLPSPRGWTYLDQVKLQSIYDNIFTPALDVEKDLVHPEVLKSRFAEFQSKHTNLISSFMHHELIARMLAPALVPAFQKAAYAQNEVNETIIACALERYRIANGKYPDSLDALAPKFVDKIPLDVCTGEPMKYRRTDDGKFLLYSVGWNQQDDGGKVVMVKYNKLKMDLNEGDWVWPEYK